MADFVGANWIDQVSYLKFRNVTFLFDIADPNRDADRFSLRRLPDLGSPFAAEGLCFRRLVFTHPWQVVPGRVYSVSPAEDCR